MNKDHIMDKKILANLRIILIVLFAYSVSIYAGTTGKISGKVVDADTKEPLVGVTVMLEGTSLGAATDIEGEFYIINIPPGVYRLKASYIGYTSQVVQQIRVQVDLTTKINFELRASSVQLDQEVTVSAKRVIQKDLTSSERSMQSDRIQDLPVRDVASILSLQAGITRDASGALHIRGGRSSEITYMVDGVQVVNPINRSSGISIDDQSIEELKAITGTFNAEYGQALSGVVNIVTKKGTEHFTANVTGFFGDNLSFDKELHTVMDNAEWADAVAQSLASKSGRLPFDFSPYLSEGTNFRSMIESKPWETKKTYMNSYNPLKRQDIQVNLSGPVPFTGNSLSYFVAGRYNYSPGGEMGVRYYMPWGVWSPVSDTVNSFVQADNAMVPLGWYRGYSTQAKLFYNSASFNVSYGLYYNNDLSYSAYDKYLPDGGRFWSTDRSTHILSLSYIFSNSTFLDVKASYYKNDNKSYAYEDPYDYRYMPTNTGDFQEYMFKPGPEDDVQVKNNPSDFNYWGNDVGRSNAFSKYVSVNADLTSQINKVNMVKLGFTARIHDLMQDYYNLQFDDATYRPIVPETYAPYHTYYTAKPKEFAAFIQDKIEFEELIINVGLRFDYFDSDGRILADVKDPQIYAPFKMGNIYKNYDPNLPVEQLVEYSVEERQAFWYKKPSAKSQFSPRVGISFPITAEGVIHFSYGHFFQNPEFRYLYDNPNFWITGAGATNLVGNSDLNAERTVMYEIGLQQQLSDNLYLHVTGFYRDIRDWIGTGTPIDTYRGVTYYTYENKDNAVAKGITLSAGYKLGSFSVNLDYTYMNANGTSSNATDAYNDLTAGRAPRVQLITLNWDQTHALNTVFSYNNDGWTGTLVGTLHSGFPYTPSISRGESTGGNAYKGYRENIERRPTTINFDLRLSKSFRVGDFAFSALLDITNLLDTRNAVSVFSDSGLPNFTMDEFLNRDRLVEVTNSQEYYYRPGMYSNARYISLGLRLSYK